MVFVFRVNDALCLLSVHEVCDSFGKGVVRRPAFGLLFQPRLDLLLPDALCDVLAGTDALDRCFALGICVGWLGRITEPTTSPRRDNT